MKRESNEIKKENDRAASFMRFCEVVRHLRAEDGCPWDRAQTHTSLKPYCIEEAAEVIGGINIWEATGDAENLKEELGDLMLQILLHAQIAEEEGLFTIREVMDGASEKMIRRHPHVFGKPMLSEQGEPITDWDAIKKQEKAGNENGSNTEKQQATSDEQPNEILERRGLPSGGYVWNVEDDDTKNVRFIDGLWTISQRDKVIYREKKTKAGE